MGERLGIFGGTFDPIHVGHLVAAVNARCALRLDRVLLVVANQPWQKSERRLTPAEDRYAMVAAAVGEPGARAAGLEASRLEIDRGGESYTADTLEQLAGEGEGGGGGGRKLFLIVGTDVANQLETWERPEVVQRLATLVVVDRPGAPDPVLGTGWRVERVAIPHLDISASDLRARAAAGQPLDWLVPSATIACIRERGLYAGG
ncbi:MAG: nicotinate-nucleotide adenylyltransferase [Actinomycetota bacterium]|nr:nicotinate-nucleotide adenylyltransferase [Actinomycetota bacterium]